jgi:hypothetical protein
VSPGLLTWNDSWHGKVRWPAGHLVGTCTNGTNGT